MTQEHMGIKFPKSNLYFEVLDAMAASFERDESLKQTFAVPFVLTCGASLECLLNDSVIGGLWEVWFDDYKPIVEGYLSMSLKGKLDTIVPLLTDNRFCINRSHGTYLALAELISQRNRVMHNKSFFEEILVSFEDDGNGSKNLKFPEAFIKNTRDVTFGLSSGERPLSYLKALKHIQAAFFRKLQGEEFGDDDLIVSR